jgi:zinc protease
VKTPPQIPWPGKVGAPGVHVVPMPVPQPTVIFALPGLMRSDKDFLAGYVANYIVGGGGFSSRLTNEVRVKRGLTYDISTSLEAFRRAGILVGQVATRADAVNQTIAVTRQTLKDFATNGPTDKELQDAKTYLTGSFPLSLDSTGHIAGILVAIQRDALGIDYLERRKALIESVTLDDAKRVARRLFDPDKLSFVVVGSPDKLGGAQEVPPNGS